MQFADFIVYGNIRWNIRQDDPATIDLKSFPGWSFINPLAMLSPMQKPGLPPTLTSNDECHLHANLFSFKIPDGEENLDQDIENINLFLRNLRFVTKQSALTSEIAGIKKYEKQRLPEIVFPKRIKGEVILFGSYRLKTAITFSSIIEADNIGLSVDIPVYSTMMLDALHALENNDYRKAILYSAISLESLARTKALTGYVEFLETKIDSSHLRVCEFQQAGDTTIKKDPIFNYLIQGDGFSKLLHEIPLYLFKGSLFIDDQELYRNAVNLYRTRNKLGHGQDVTDNGNDLFPSNEKSVRQALECACKVFDWFGETGYHVPVYDPVKLEDPIVS